jgi:hypothetical protein
MGNDAPLNSLKESNASPRMKTMEGKRIGAHFLAYNTFGVRGACWSFEMGTRTSDECVSYSY